MTDNRLETVGDVIAALSAYARPRPCGSPPNPATRWNTTSHAWCVPPDDAEGDGTPPTDPPVVWLGVGDQVGYLPASAADALEWSR